MTSLYQPRTYTAVILRPGFLARTGRIIEDTWVIMRRDMWRIRRRPVQLIEEATMPTMFLLLFNYVFGGAIGGGSGIDYAQFLVPAIIVQTALFGGLATGIGLAEDLEEGVIDRFRSLPMSGIAVLAGRVLSDVARNSVGLVPVLAIGYGLGFRFEAGIPAAVLAMLLALLIGIAISWINAAIATYVRGARAVEMMGMIWLFPLLFASSMFVPVETMPGWLRVFAANTPLSVSVDAFRALAGDGTLGWPAAKAVVWSIGLIALFAPLASRRLRRMVR